MRKHLHTLIIILAVASFAGQHCACAQDAPYKYDVGAQLGMSGYLGDCNQSNMFRRPGISAGVSARYIPNARMAFRAVFNTLSLSGDTRDFGMILPSAENFSFKSTVMELNVRYEFNFFAYGIGETFKRLKRWSPYLAAGLGASVATSSGQTNAGFNIPMAIGLKYKLKPRINLGLEFSMTKVFSDHMDGPIADLYQIKSSFMKNTDWYSNLSFSVSFEFGERCETCHYVD